MECLLSVPRILMSYFTLPRWLGQAIIPTFPINTEAEVAKPGL